MIYFQLLLHYTCTNIYNSFYSGIGLSVKFL